MHLWKAAWWLNLGREAQMTKLISWRRRRCIERLLQVQRGDRVSGKIALQQTTHPFPLFCECIWSLRKWLIDSGHDAWRRSQYKGVLLKGDVAIKLSVSNVEKHSAHGVLMRRMFLHLKMSEHCWEIKILNTFAPNWSLYPLYIDCQVVVRLYPPYSSQRILIKPTLLMKSSVSEKKPRKWKQEKIYYDHSEDHDV